MQLQDKIQYVLDESRILILGAQVLVGFHSGILSGLLAVNPLTHAINHFSLEGFACAPDCLLQATFLTLVSPLSTPSMDNQLVARHA
jgi:hypothetical protein